VGEDVGDRVGGEFGVDVGGSEGCPVGATHCFSKLRHRTLRIEMKIKIPSQF